MVGLQGIVSDGPTHRLPMENRPSKHGPLTTVTPPVVRCQAMESITGCGPQAASLSWRSLAELGRAARCLEV